MVTGVQQHLDAEWKPGHAAEQKGRERPPADGSSQAPDGEDLDAETAQQHDLHRLNPIVDHVEEDRAADRREGKAGDAGCEGRGEHGAHDRQVAAGWADQSQEPGTGGKPADGERRRPARPPARCLSAGRAAQWAARWSQCPLPNMRSLS